MQKTKTRSGCPLVGCLFVFPLVWALESLLYGKQNVDHVEQEKSCCGTGDTLSFFRLDFKTSFQIKLF